MIAWALLDFALRNWALISIVITLAVLVTIPTLILRKYVNIIANIFCDSPVPLGMDARDYKRIEGELVHFRAFDGHLLTGMWLPANPDRPLRGTIIFAAELGSDMYSAARYGAALLDAGYEIFTFDFRGHGQSSDEHGYSPRLWSSDREQADMLGAIAFVEDELEQQGRPKAVGLIGVSRGAGAAILGALNVPSVKAIMIDGAFSTDTYLEYLMQRWVSIFAKVRLVYENHPPTFWRFLRWLTLRRASCRMNCRFPSVRKVIPRLGRMPLLVIHGERDGHIPVAQGQLLYDLAVGPKYLWICPGAKHNQAVAVQPRLYAEYSVRFFNQHLAGCAAEDGLEKVGVLTAFAQPLATPVRVSYQKYIKPERRSKVESRR